MPKPLSVTLTSEQRQVLEDARAHHPKPYIRERAAGVLKVADGASLRQVAAVGLLQRRRHETVSRWVERFLAEGLAGLGVRKGRGRKPAFSPSAQDPRASVRRRARSHPPRP